MKPIEKVLMVVSIIAAAGAFGICSVIFNNNMLPMGERIIAEALGVINLACTIYFNQDMVKRSKK